MIDFVPCENLRRIFSFFSSSAPPLLKKSCHCCQTVCNQTESLIWGVEQKQCYICFKKHVFRLTNSEIINAENGTSKSFFFFISFFVLVQFYRVYWFSFRFQAATTPHPYIPFVNTFNWHRTNSFLHTLKSNGRHI